MTTFTTLTVATDGTVSVTEKGTEDSLAYLQAQVGGYIELVSLQDDLDLFLDEDGIGKGLEPNFIATALADYYGFNQGSFLVGPAVFAGGTDAEGETLSLTPEQVEELKGLASRATSSAWYAL